MGWTYYWGDHCDAYPNGWTCSTPCPWSLDGISPAEGTGCFKGLYVPIAVATSLIKTISPSITLPSPFYLYFYVKVVSSHTSNDWNIWAKLTSAYVGVNIDYVSGSNFRLQIQNAAGTGAFTTASLNAWHLIMLKVEQVGANVVVDLYVDGVYKNSRTMAWIFGDFNEMYMFDDYGNFEHYVDWFRIPRSSFLDSVDVFIDGVSIMESCVLSAHYIKSHPNPDPDTFDIRVLPECGERINYFDTVEFKKSNVTEFYGFVEEITPEVGEDGLEYLITGRCWKLMTWKKWNERFQESREVGPIDSEGNIETGFFGAVKPEELVKFIMRCPISEHPKGKIRHKIGWGIASDYWDCCANVTAECHYPEWVALRYTGLAWRGRGDVDIYYSDTLLVNGFDSTHVAWTEWGISPYLDVDSNVSGIHGNGGKNTLEGDFSFQNLPASRDYIGQVILKVKSTGGAYDGYKAYLYDGTTWHYIGYLDYHWGWEYTNFSITSYLDTVTKVNNAKVRFESLVQSGTCKVIYAKLEVVSSEVAAPADQRVDDYFIVDMLNPYDDVTAMLIECRNNPIMYARNYKIQYADLVGAPAFISSCCVDEVKDTDTYWKDFTDNALPISVINNQARDILHSWEPEDNVRCIRIKLTLSACNAWEISQIYIWQADEHKYRLMDEGD